MQTQAMKVVAMAYDDDGYCRQYAHEYLPRGAVLESSSNDDAGNSGFSFSPTEVYRCPDGSRVEIAYSDCSVVNN